jgi:Polysaccharide biosynthesis enzyme WcbI
MDRVVVVGNCQAKALEMMIATNVEFAKRFEFVSFPAVHEIPEETMSSLHEAVANATVLIAQRIEEDYRDGIGLGTETLARIAGNATIIRWPSVYWAGYFPDLFYMRNAAGQPVVDGPFDYHDRSILSAYGSGLNVDATRLLLEDSQVPSDARTWASQATAELDIRGQACDVQVTAFIDESFQRELLFFTMNHPANRLLAFIGQQITELLDVPGKVDQGQMPDEVLGWTFYPLHPNHVKALDLQFGGDLSVGRVPFRIRGETYGTVDAVRAFFDYYDANPQLVELNLEPRIA